MSKHNNQRGNQIRIQAEVSTRLLSLIERLIVELNADPDDNEKKYTDRQALQGTLDNLRRYFDDLIIIQPTNAEILAAWQHGIEQGHYEWIVEGQSVKLTQAGQKHVDHLLRTDPKAAATMRQLLAGSKKTVDRK